MLKLDKNKRYLITVSGRPNSGKSTVLANKDKKVPAIKSVYDRFIAAGATCLKDLKPKARKDIVVVLEYKGEKIGISAGGDCVKGILDHWLPALEQEDCKYIITASSIHRNGDTCAYVNDFAKGHGFDLISLYKFPYHNDISKLEEFIFDLF